MIELAATLPATGAVPVRAGEMVLDLFDPGPVTWIAARPGAGLSEAVLAATGCACPTPVMSTGAGALRLVWVAPGQALALGPCPDIPGAWTTDQSDGFACLTLSGGGARDALARLAPADLRDRAMPVDGAARTLLGHITVTLWREGPEEWRMLVPRSMAASAGEDLTRAMRAVAARRAL